MAELYHGGAANGGRHNGEKQVRHRGLAERGREALALADELGMRQIVAHCHLGLGKVPRRAGNGQQAQEHLTTAITMHREMEMRFWLEKAETKLGA